MLGRAIHWPDLYPSLPVNSVRDPRAGVAAEVMAGWLRDPWAYDQAVRAANTVLEAYRPEGEIELPEIEENPSGDAALYELERNPGPSWAAGVLYQVADLPRGSGRHGPMSFATCSATSPMPMSKSRPNEHRPHSPAQSGKLGTPVHGCRQGSHRDDDTAASGTRSGGCASC